MRKKLLLLSLIALSFFTAKAQVEDISVIVTPTVGYNWFDKKSTVDEGVMYGIQAGFGFGKFIELRGIYERSVDLKQQFGYYQDDIQQVFPNFQFKSRDIKVDRIGGEFKTNIQVGDFSPYILLGTGVQTFEWESSAEDFHKNQNIYASAGLGFKINLSDRVTLNLEGRGLVYNMNPGSLLYDASYIEDPDNPSFGNWIGDKSHNRMYNWSATAGLQFYLGGRNDSHLSALDRAYLRRFSGDMSGFKLIVEPVVSYINFNNETAFRNTYFAGAQVGFDLSEYVGLKGYFLQSKEDDKVNLKFDKLSMYGVDFMGKLNVPRGIVPYITVGGGYLDVHEDYNGRDKVRPESQYFAKGGLGLGIPLGKYVDIFGAVNLLFTVDNDNADFTEVIQPDQLKRHTMYNAGVRLKIGSSSNTGYAIDQTYHNRYDNDLNAYNQRIKELEKELKDAYNSNDVEKATRVIEEKKRMEIKQRGGVYIKEDSVVILTPAEFENVIDRVVKQNDDHSNKNLESRLNNLEQMLMDLNRKYEIKDDTKQDSPTVIIEKSESSAVSASDQEARALRAEKAQTEANEMLLKEIRKLNQELESQKENIEQMKLQQADVRVEEISVEPKAKIGKAYHSDYGLLGGVNFGQASTFNLGVRKYVSYSNSSLIFMPEAYFAFGDQKGFGLSANGLIPVNIGDSNFSPYAGIGLGLNMLSKKWTLNPNFIVGADYQSFIGNFFVDYTVRGAFKNNQIALGYRFKF